MTDKKYTTTTHNGKNCRMEYEYSEDWTLSEERPGYHFKTLRYKNCTINVYSPILTPEEKEKREKHVIRILESVMGDYLRRKAEKKDRGLEEIT